MNTLIKAGRNVWERLNETRVKEKTIFILLLVGIVIILAPMLMIAKYNVPSADDYSHGAVTHLTWEESHSLLKVLIQSVQYVYKEYLTWQGLYSTFFMSSLQPAIFGEQWYPLTTYVMFISLFGGVAYLCTVVFRRILDATWYQTGIVAIILCAVFTQLLPSPAEAFYWYAGAVCYTFFFGISLILYAKILTYIQLSATALSPAQKTRRLLSMSVLSVIVAGSNHITGLATAILYMCGLVLMLVQKKRSCRGLIVPFCFFAAGFIASILAPGNSIRQATYHNRPTVLSSIYLSFEAAVRFAQGWLTPALFFLVIFLIPLLYKIAARTKYSYSYPLVVLLGSFCLFASMFCPHIYAAGSIGPGRLLDIVYYAFVILLIFDLLYVLGWCKRTAEKYGVCVKTEKQEGKGERPVYSAAFVLVVLALFLFGSKLADARYTSSSTMGILFRGEASAYHNTAQERLELLHDDSQQDVVLPRYPVKPWVLYFSDVATDPADWQNRAVSRYYQKNSVVLEPED